MNFPELIWSGLVIVGGLLLIQDASALSGKQRTGVMVIFGGFIFQVCWALLHQTEPAAVTWNFSSQIGVIYVGALVAALVLFGYPGRFRKGKKRE